MYKLSILSMKLHVKEQYECDRGKFLSVNVKKKKSQHEVANLSNVTSSGVRPSKVVFFLSMFFMQMSLSPQALMEPLT